jgi:polysaccharide export outer membrane protein
MNSASASFRVSYSSGRTRGRKLTYLSGKREHARFGTTLSSSWIIAGLLAAAPLICAGQVRTTTPVQSTQATAPANTPATASISGLTDEPIFIGEVVNVSIFGAADLSTITRVSGSGDIAMPYLGAVHILGMSSADAADLITKDLKVGNLVTDPHVTVTVDSANTGITVLGEVKNPGVYTPPGKRLLSDVLAMAGGLTTSSGRVIEISSESAPDQKTLIPWDPTMHNTSTYDRLVYPGQRILVRPCGVIYVGGNVGKPGAYPVCGSRTITLSEAVALASGILPASYQSHTIIVRTRPDGTRVVEEIDLGKALKAKGADPIVEEDDIVYVPASGLKTVLLRTPDYALSLATTALYAYHP